jgi:Rps23 Pro-64 3,4-dihydroxylase Tpa1-like proline 4-hydroxylase
LSGVEAQVAPHARIFDFLPEHELGRLLDWTLSIRDRFKPAIVSKEGEFRLDPGRRIALTTGQFGPLEPMLRDRLLAALPELMASTGTGGPTPTSLELELAAHGDGAYYRPHIDIPVGAHRQQLGANRREDRILSAVYYFYAEPKAFSGGQLRLFPLGPPPAARDSDQANHVDLEPVRNSLVAFPSWFPHEVRPISCPSGEFQDYRFAINCWYCRAVAPSGGDAR